MTISSATLGEAFSIRGLALSHLQRHVDRRKKRVKAVTIRKEIDTLRTAWNWAVRTGMVAGDFPSHGLIFPKETDKLPFMTWAEIERRLEAGADPDELWECLYLTMPEIEQFLDIRQGAAGTGVVLPHDPVRRAHRGTAVRDDPGNGRGRESGRWRGNDSREEAGQGRLTTRRVPLGDTLAEELKDWLPGRISLFGTGATIAIRPGHAKSASSRR